MATTNMRILIRRDGSENWDANGDNVLLSGEMGFETDTYKLKIGNGSTNWDTLDYFAGGITGLQQSGGLLLDTDNKLMVDTDLLIGDIGADFSVKDYVDQEVQKEAAERQTADELINDALSDRYTKVETEQLIDQKADLSGANFTGKVTAPVAENVIPFMFSNQTAFPTPESAHGAVLHSHEDASMFFAHAGDWHQILDVNTAYFKTEVDDAIKVVDDKLTEINIALAGADTVLDDRLKLVEDVSLVGYQTEGDASADLFTGDVYYNVGFDKAVVMNAKAIPNIKLVDDAHDLEAYWSADKNEVTVKGVYTITEVDTALAGKVDTDSPTFTDTINAPDAIFTEPIVAGGFQTTGAIVANNIELSDDTPESGALTAVSAAFSGGVTAQNMTVSTSLQANNLLATDALECANIRASADVIAEGDVRGATASAGTVDAPFQAAEDHDLVTRSYMQSITGPIDAKADVNANGVANLETSVEDAGANKGRFFAALFTPSGGGNPPFYADDNTAKVNGVAVGEVYLKSNSSLDDAVLAVVMS